MKCKGNLLTNVFGKAAGICFCCAGKIGVIGLYCTMVKGMPAFLRRRTEAGSVLTNLNSTP